MVEKFIYYFNFFTNTWLGYQEVYSNFCFIFKWVEDSSLFPFVFYLKKCYDIYIYSIFKSVVLKLFVLRRENKRKTCYQLATLKSEILNLRNK